MKTRWVWMVVLALVFGVVGCKKKLPPPASAPSKKNVDRMAKEGFFDVSAPAVKAYLKANPKAVVLDVRTPQEFNAGHLPNAKNINVLGSHFQKQVASLPKDKPVVLYCRSGARSRRALEQMKQMKFKHIVHMQHGILDWQRHSFSTSKK